MHINERHTYIWAPQIGSAKRDPYADSLDLMVEHGSRGMVTGRETCKKPTQGFPYHLKPVWQGLFWPPIQDLLRSHMLEQTTNIPNR